MLKGEGLLVVRKARALRVVLAIACASLACASSTLAEVTLQIRDGRVTLDAREAQVGEILAEWSRVGQTTIVGGEEIVGPPVTIQMVDVPESAALDVILKQCAGYVAGGWPAGLAGASIFQRIMILVTSTAPAPTPRAQPATSLSSGATPGAARRGPPRRKDITPPSSPGPGFETDTPDVSSPSSAASPWFPGDGLSRVPGVAAPSPTQTEPRK
jgi:hypothetical protein